jgi:hypothetical protein
MSSRHFAHGQSSPAAGGNPAILALAPLSHSPASVLQSGQNFHVSGIPSSHPPHTPGGGGLTAPDAEPHSTQNKKLAGHASPQWQSHSELTVGEGLRQGTPASDSPHAGQNLKLEGTVQSPSTTALFFWLQVLQIQSPSWVRRAAALGAGSFADAAALNDGAASGLEAGLDPARNESYFFIAAICSARASTPLKRAESTLELLLPRSLGLEPGFAFAASATDIKSNGIARPAGLGPLLAATGRFRDGKQCACFTIVHSLFSSLFM